MNRKIMKVGLVGASANGNGWGANAHIPAIKAVENISLAALCTSKLESAIAASKTYGVDRAYFDIKDIVKQKDLDIISCVVRIPNHYEVVMAALNASKHVYCEWPLGANLAETEEMATVARAKGVVTAIGLQGRHDPTLNFIKELCDEDWLGDILSIQMTMLTTGTYERPSRQAWEQEQSKAVTLMGIAGGHTLDYIGYCFGPLTEVSAKVATRVKQLRMADTGEMVDAEAADNVLINGLFANGALLSYQISAVPYHADGWRLAVYGSKGTVLATTPIMPQISPITLVGAQGNKPLTELPVPARLRVVPAAVPEGPPQNVGQAYIRMAEAIREGKQFAPNFDDALEVHRLLEAIQRSSDQGCVVQLS